MFVCVLLLNVTVSCRCVQVFFVIFFFFFKQKTAYEMRISDWSSDVCSSDLSRICTSGVGKDMGSIRDIAPLTTTASSRKRTIDTVSKKFRSILRVAGHPNGGTW